MKFETMTEPALRAPEALDRTLTLDEFTRRRRLWAGKLRGAIVEHGAWGLLVTRSDGDVQLFDTSHDGVWCAAEYGAEAALIRPEPGWDSPPMPPSTEQRG